MNPFKVGDRIEQKKDYGISKIGWQGTINNTHGPVIIVLFDNYPDQLLSIKYQDCYLLQPDGEKSVKEDVSKDVHETKEDKGWGF